MYVKTRLSQLMYIVKGCSSNWVLIVPLGIPSTLFCALKIYAKSGNIATKRVNLFLHMFCKITFFLPNVNIAADLEHSQKTINVSFFKLNCLEERAHACAGLANLVLEPDKVTSLMKHEIVRRVAPLILDNDEKVQEAASGVLRYMVIFLSMMQLRVGKLKNVEIEPISFGLLIKALHFQLSYEFRFPLWSSNFPGCPV